MDTTGRRRRMAKRAIDPRFSISFTSVTPRRFGRKCQTALADEYSPAGWRRSYPRRISTGGTGVTHTRRLYESA